MLIHDPAERKKIAEARMLALLNFLKDETWSDFSSLRRVMGFSRHTHHPVYKVLNRAIQAGYIIRHGSHDIRPGIVLWGITMQELSRVVRVDDPVFPGYFEPGKLRYGTLEHHLFNQRIRLALEEKGGSNWCHGDRGRFAAQFPGIRHIDSMSTTQALAWNVGTCRERRRAETLRAPEYQCGAQGQMVP